MSKGLNKRDIKSALGETKKKIIFKKKTGSTNTDLKNLAFKDKALNKVVIALKQTQGRGRLGRSFYSPENNGIYLSYFLKPSLNNEDIVLITSASAVAVCKALEKNITISPKIKWVNDIFYEGRKLCGILVEAVRDKDNGLSGVVIGIGLNCIRGNVPDELNSIIGYLSDFCDGFNVNQIAADIISELNDIENLIKDNGLCSEYKKRSLVIGKNIKVLGDAPYRAYAEDVDERCGLVVKSESGEIRTLTTGEITIRIDE